MLRLVNQLLDIAKLDAGQEKLRARPGNLVSFVRGIVESFESAARDKNITLRIESDREMLQQSFDRDKVEKIVANLVSNALKFTPRGGEVRVIVHPSTGVNSQGAEIVVRDTGVGIAVNALPHIFDRFYQVDDSHTRQQEGTGIGLALVKGLVDVHRGEISVRSEIGVGTTFTVRLPFLRDDAARESHDHSAEPQTEVTKTELAVLENPPTLPPHDGREHDGDVPFVLIVEDNADVRMYMREHLDPHYRVLEATNGEEGLNMAIDAAPELIISDVMMPGMDGFEFCRKLKTDLRTSHIPIILLTARAGRDDKLAGLETGADDYLTKPFDARELLARGKNLIDQRKNLRERFLKEGILRPKDLAVTSMDEKFLRRIVDIVDAHISDSSFTVERLSDEIFLSRMQLHRKLKALVGRSPWEFIRLTRLERAAQLLVKRAGSVAEIAYQVGFEEPSSFSQAFHSHFGVSPSEYSARGSSRQT